MIRILVADDHAVVRQGIKMILKLASGFELSAEASDGKGIMQHLHSSSEFDIVLMDMNMPGISGINLIEYIKAIRKDLRLLVFSMNNDPGMILRALKAGAGGYISKNQNPEILIEAIRKVAGGGMFIDPLLAEQLVFNKMLGEQNDRLADLSNREVEVYRLLVAGKSINEIADTLIISNKTVSSHKKNLMEKMHFSSMSELVRYAVQHRLFDDSVQNWPQTENAISLGL